LQDLYLVKNFTKWAVDDKKRKKRSLPSVIELHKVSEAHASDVINGDQHVRLKLNNGTSVYFVIDKKTGNYIK
jgi:hypothetical protein